MSETPATDAALVRSAVLKMSWRILPLVVAGYLVSIIDRVNVGFAAIQMNADLKFSATVYGLGAGLFYLSYAFCEVPSNIVLSRVGARRWLARIMISWGVLATAMMFVKTPWQFYLTRFLLGVAEAGYFPGVVYYMAHWFPSAQRGRAISRFYCALPFGVVIMGGLSGALLGLDGRAGLEGWQWLFLVEGSPAILVGLMFLFFLPDAPEKVSWLTSDEKGWIARELAADAVRIGEPASHNVLAALRNPLVFRFGVLGFLGIGSAVTMTLSGPLLLQAATGLDALRIGGIVSLSGVFGVVTMLVTGWYSDRRGDRFATMWTGSAMMAVGFLAMAFAPTPGTLIAAYLVQATAFYAVTLSQVMSYSEVLHIRQLAVGCAAANTVSQVGAFLMPFGWGLAKDATGGFRIGLLALAVFATASVVLTLELRRRVRRTVRHEAVFEPAPA